MTRDLFIPVEIVVGETVRCDDGLALSSRNVYLSEDDRKISIALYKGLLAGKDAWIKGGDRGEIIKAAEGIILGVEGVKLEYLSLVNPESLMEYNEDAHFETGILSGAIRVGTTRLIDNILLGIKVSQWK
jgi:pantoate--beta-alanine ligase